MNKHRKAAYRGFVLLSLTCNRRRQNECNDEMQIMKELVPSLMVVLKARRNTAKVFRETRGREREDSGGKQENCE
jgi:hypothetical protein